MRTCSYYMRFSELTAVLGPAVAAKLVSELGGRRFHVPEHPPAGHVLIAAIGEIEAARLAEHLAASIGGIFVELPTAMASAFSLYRKRLRELAYAPGWTELRIARELGITCRTVRRMRAKLRAEHGYAGRVSGAPAR